MSATLRREFLSLLCREFLSLLDPRFGGRVLQFQSCPSVPLSISSKEFLKTILNPLSCPGVKIAHFEHKIIIFRNISKTLH